MDLIKLQKIYLLLIPHDNSPFFCFNEDFQYLAFSPESNHYIMFKTKPNLERKHVVNLESEDVSLRSISVASCPVALLRADVNENSANFDQTRTVTIIGTRLALQLGLQSYAIVRIGPYLTGVLSVHVDVRVVHALECVLYTVSQLGQCLHKLRRNNRRRAAETLHRPKRRT